MLKGAAGQSSLSDLSDASPIIGRNQGMRAVRTVTVSERSQAVEEAKVTARVTIDDGSLGTNEAFAITPEPTAVLDTIVRKEMKIVDDDQ